MQGNTNASTEAVPAQGEGAPPHVSKALTFARQHPALSVLGAATVGLFGGLELAAGMILGAGVAALINRHQQPAGATESHGMRERARRAFERTPQEARKRVRAVVQAARGKLPPVEAPPEPQPAEPQAREESRDQMHFSPA
jgi:hypothetical protein